MVRYNFQRLFNNFTRLTQEQHLIQDYDCSYCDHNPSNELMTILVPLQLGKGYPSTSLTRQKKSTHERPAMLYFSKEYYGNSASWLHILPVISARITFK